MKDISCIFVFMISINDYPHLVNKYKLLTGLSSTLPIEVIYAAGRFPVDLNNIFITSKNTDEILKSAHNMLSRTICSWTLGVLTEAISLKLPECVIVTEGDCAHTIPMLGILRDSGIKTIPFEFPIDRDFSKIKAEILKLMKYYNVSISDCENIKEKFDKTRMILKQIDELTYKENKVSGFENHLFLITASDFETSPDEFHKKTEKFLHEACQRNSKKPLLRIGYTGMPPIFSNFYDYISSLDCEVVFNETQKQFSLIDGIGLDIFKAYQNYTYPYTFSSRLQDIKKAVEERELDCLIHYVQSFCFHQIEDKMLRDGIKNIPILTIEGDRPGILNENDRLKIESFVTNVIKSKKKKSGLGEKSKNIVQVFNKSLENKLVAGIDIGSRAVKVAFFDNEKISYRVFDTMDFIIKYMTDGNSEMKKSFESEIFGRENSNIEYYSTGYGRYKARIFDASPIPEIQCHTAGACYLTGLADFTLLDIGGQDMKAIEVRGGEVYGFSMNDKCAAGSGRYLENMARILKTPLSKLASCHENPVPLSVTCATFGETEVICKLMEGVNIEEILAGVNYTVYARVEPMLINHRSRTGTLVVTSGIALNNAFLKILEKHSDFKQIIVPPNPQLVGAIGACVYAKTM